MIALEMADQDGHIRALNLHHPINQAEFKAYKIAVYS
jgi:hypothetical protein